MNAYTLFIAGHTARNDGLAERALSLIRSRFGDQASLTVIDAMANPLAARKARVFITPTLIKTSPEPILRAFGDFTHLDRILSVLAGGESDWPCSEALNDPIQNEACAP